MMFLPEWTPSSRLPITKARFLEVMIEYGANAQLASDCWFIRPLTHRNDTEDEVRGNLELMKGDGWIERNNPRAAALERHEFVPRPKGGCVYCKGPKGSPAHNTEPIAESNMLAFTDRRKLQ